MLLRADQPWRAQDEKVLREVIDADCYDLKSLVGRRDLLSFNDNLVVVDIGAHIGSFARACANHWNDLACTGIEYFGFELNAKNWPLLARNCGIDGESHFEGRPFHAAVDQGRTTDQYWFYDSILETGSTATGASQIRPRGSKPVLVDHAVRSAPEAQIPVIDMMTVLDCLVRREVSVLKLDCEGAEFRILAGPSSWLDRVGVIVGEYHDRERWEEFVANHSRLAFWDYREVSRREDKPIGIFHLVNPNWSGK